MSTNRLQLPPLTDYERNLLATLAMHDAQRRTEQLAAAQADPSQRELRLDHARAYEDLIVYAADDLEADARNRG